MIFAFVITSLVIWCIIFLLPWQPYRTREQLDASSDTASHSIELTVLIPARNEEQGIQQTLLNISNQAPFAKIIVIDDESTDNTRNIVLQLGLQNVQLIAGLPLPPRWSGKLWALEQGFAFVETRYTLLLDADIEVQPGIINRILTKMNDENLQLLSLMATLKMQSFWEKTLIPAFIYFFKFLYPFHLINHSRLPIAGAAGGCLCVETKMLKKIGGFSSIKEALIDDCSLAKKIKDEGGRIWLGLTHSVISTRSYEQLSTVWEMVTRTAFTQLQYSLLLLLFCTVIMSIMFIVPVVAIFSGSIETTSIGLVTWLLCSLSYYPTLRYYQLNVFWILFLPYIAVNYLLMTWHSAIRYWFGIRSKWKSRKYSTEDIT